MMDDSLHGDGAAHKKDVSLAVWLWDEGMAEVIAKKGQMWGTTGITRSGRLLCHVEEAVYVLCFCSDEMTSAVNTGQHHGKQVSDICL